MTALSWKTYFKYIPLPLLVAAYPVLFLYGHNASALVPQILAFPLGASLITAGAVYTLFCLIQRKPLTASLSTVVFVVFYYLYGPFYHLLVKWDRFSVEWFTLLPLLIALTLALAALLNRLRPAAAGVIQKTLLVVAGALVLYNLFGVTFPVEAQKVLAEHTPAPVADVSSVPVQNEPDIYYIILDEYAGFDSSRSYFHDPTIDQFQTYLEQNHFFLITGSRSPTLNTGSEISSRLNLQPYPEDVPNAVKMDAIDNSKVMQVLKAYGYQTVAIDMAFQGIKADESISYSPSQVNGMAADAFQKLYLDTTMFNPLTGYFQSTNQTALKQRDMILYSFEKTVDPGANIGSPKFVFTHVLLPHEPFIFDKDGNLLPPQDSDNWTYYLGQHEYTSILTEQLISKLLAQANPNNPPVIILQSDHGARNLATLAADGKTVLNVQLTNYPLDQDAHDILNALYLPGFDTSQLSNTMDPTATFAIILNHYLNAGLTVNTTPVQ